MLQWDLSEVRKLWFSAKLLTGSSTCFYVKQGVDFYNYNKPAIHKFECILVPNCEIQYWEFIKHFISQCDKLKI